MPSSPFKFAKLYSAKPTPKESAEKVQNWMRRRRSSSCGEASVAACVLAITTFPPVSIGISKWVVPDVGIHVPALRIERFLVRERLIGSRVPPLPRTEVPRPKVIEARLRISFFGGTTGSSAGIVQASGYAGGGVGVSDAEALIKNSCRKLMGQRRVLGNDAVGR
jgi:hypothetical protein